MKITGSVKSFMERMRSNRFTRVIVEILFWAIVLVCSTIAQGNATLAEDNTIVVFEPVSYILFGVILISYSIIYMVDAAFKKKHRVELIVGFVSALIDFVFGVLVIIFKSEDIIVNLACTFLFFNIIARLFVRVFLERAHRIIRAIISILLFILWFLLSVVSYEPGFGHVTYLTLSMYFTLLASILEIVLLVFSNLDLPVLKKVIFKTFAFEVFTGLLILILSFSFYFWYFESNMTSYFDGVWYCFAIVTTIGFGDVTATTIIGRILTIVLGFYGMIVVALLTSIIVNFYMESKGSSSTDSINETKEEEKKELPDPSKSEESAKKEESDGQPLI